MRTRTLAALAATTLTLTACGGSNNEASAPAATPSSTSSSPASSATASAPASASPTPSLQPTYDNPDADQPTGEALGAETPPPGDDTDTQPAPFSSATDPAG